MGHHDERAEGCPIVALGSDAARQGAEVKASFEAGIRDHLETLGRWTGEADDDGSGDRSMAILSTMVGAMLLSRMVNNDALSERILQAASKSVLAEASRPL